MIVVFDLDGTLVDSFHDVHAALTKAASEFNIPPLSEEKTRYHLGPGVSEMIDSAIAGTAVEHDAFRDRYRKHYHEQSTLHTRSFPGISSILEWIEGKGIKKAVLTNKPESPAKHVLTNLNLMHHFELVVGPDTFGVHKPDPRGLNTIISRLGATKDSTLFIGDTEYDILTGKAAGVKTVGVTYGYRDRDLLKKHNPTHIIDTPEELKAIIEEQL